MGTISVPGGRIDVGNDYRWNLALSSSVGERSVGNVTNPGPGMGLSTTRNRDRIPLAAGDKVKVPDSSVVVRHYSFQRDTVWFRFRGVETQITDEDFTGEPSNENTWKGGVIYSATHPDGAIWTYHNVYVRVNQRTAPMLAQAGYITAVSVGDGVVYYQNPPPTESRPTEDSSGVLANIGGAVRGATSTIKTGFISVAVVAVVIAGLYFIPRMKG